MVVGLGNPGRRYSRTRHNAGFMFIKRLAKEWKIKLKKRKEHSVLVSGTVEKICRRQDFICPVCGQSLNNGEDIEIHHNPSLKEFRLNPSLNKQFKTVALHKLCHTRVHRKETSTNL